MMQVRLNRWQTYGKKGQTVVDPFQPFEVGLRWEEECAEESTALNSFNEYGLYTLIPFAMDPSYAPQCADSYYSI